VADRLSVVKWHNWKMHFIWQVNMYDPPVTLPEPKAINPPAEACGSGSSSIHDAMRRELERLDKTPAYVSDSRRRNPYRTLRRETKPGLQQPSPIFRPCRPALFELGYMAADLPADLHLIGIDSS
jgi:hypothetical protein